METTSTKPVITRAGDAFKRTVIEGSRVQEGKQIVRFGFFRLAEYLILAMVFFGVAPAINMFLIIFRVSFINEVREVKFTELSVLMIEMLHWYFKMVLGFGLWFSIMCFFTTDRVISIRKKMFAYFLIGTTAVLCFRGYGLFGFTINVVSGAVMWRRERMGVLVNQRSELFHAVSCLIIWLVGRYRIYFLLVFWLMMMKKGYAPGDHRGTVDQTKVVVDNGVRFLSDDCRFMQQLTSFDVSLVPDDIAYLVSRIPVDHQGSTIFRRYAQIGDAVLHQSLVEFSFAQNLTVGQISVLKNRCLTREAMRSAVFALQDAKHRCIGANGVVATRGAGEILEAIVGACWWYSYSRGQDARWFRHSVAFMQEKLHLPVDCEVGVRDTNEEWFDTNESFI